MTRLHDVRSKWIILVILGALISISYHGIVDKRAINLKTQRLIMRFVRDFSRYKSRVRENREYSLVPLLLGMDEVSSSLEDLFLANSSSSDSIDIIELEELSRAKGVDENDPLWICILDHVFDVREGSKFYGVGGPYEVLAGRDATAALAIGDLSLASKEHHTSQFKDGEYAEALRWLEYFASHKKYRHIGRLPRSTDVTVNIDELVSEEIQANEREYDEDHIDEDYIKNGREVPDWHPPVLDGTDQCPGGGGDSDVRNGNDEKIVR